MAIHSNTLLNLDELNNVNCSNVKPDRGPEASTSFERFCCCGFCEDDDGKKLTGAEKSSFFLELELPTLMPCAQGHCDYRLRSGDLTNNSTAIGCWHTRFESKAQHVRRQPAVLYCHFCAESHRPEASWFNSLGINKCHVLPGHKPTASSPVAGHLTSSPRDECISGAGAFNEDSTNSPCFFQISSGWHSA